MTQSMSVVIDSRISDENMLYSPMEQPENDALNDSKDVSKDSNALMEDQMSASNDHLEDGPQQPQHIFVLDRQSSLGKREHDSIPSSAESSVVSGDESTMSERKKHELVYGKKKQKLSARQRKRQLERKFGSDFQPGTIRHRLNFLQHNFGDQLALIEESLPKTFFRNMNLETFIKNKMEQHEQHTHDSSSTKRSPSFRRSPERQRKASIKEMPQIKESKPEREMAEIMTFAPLETPHFENSSSMMDDGPPHTSHNAFPLDRTAREWRLSKFLEESPPPSPSPIEEPSNDKVLSVEKPVPEVPILDALDDAPTMVLIPTTTSDAPAEEQDAAMVPPSSTTTVPASTAEEKDVPVALEEQVDVVAPSDAPADVARISATGIVEDVVTTTGKETPMEEGENEEPTEASSAASQEEQVAILEATEESAAPKAAPVNEEIAAAEATPEPTEEAPATEEPVVVSPAEATAKQPVEAPDVIHEAEVAGDQGDDDTIESSASSLSQPEGVVEMPVEEPQPQAATESSEGVVESPIPPTPATTQEEGVVSESEPQEEEETPVSAQVQESATQIPATVEDTPSAEGSPQVQANDVAPEDSKQATEITPEEPKPEGSSDAPVSEPEPMVVDATQTAPQDVAAAPAPPAPIASEGVVSEGIVEEEPSPVMTIDTSAAPVDDGVVPSTPVGDQSVSPASATSFESPKALDAVERARLEQATPVKTTAAPGVPPTPDAVERARLEQQTPVKSKPDVKASPEEGATAETSDADSTAATTTDENKDMQNCPSPNSVMDSELGEKDQKVKKEVPLKKNRRIRFADEAGQELTKEYVIEREANYASRIVVMLLSPRDRKFEFLHAEYPLDESTTVQVLLEQVPLLATNDAFRTKKFNALLQTETSRQLDNNLALQDYCFKESEIVLGIPDDFTVANMTKMAVPLLLNKKLMKTVKQAIRKGRGLKTVQSGEEWRK